MPSAEAISLYPPAIPQAAAPRLTVTCAKTIEEVDRRTWDALVPRDAPHLRYGFLRAVERSAFGRNPHYLGVHRGRRLLGVAVAYVMPVDLLTLAPPKYARRMNALRNAVAPRLLFLQTLSCGPMITNCNHGFCLADSLTEGEQQEVISELLQAMEATGIGSVLCGFEFTEEEAARFGPQMEACGWLQAPSLPGTRMAVTWRSLDEYVANMRKAFRRAVRKDLRAAESLQFDVIDDFSSIADEAWQLYNNVLAKADHVFEKLTPEFLRELGKFDQARLMTARERSTGRLVGIELLLQGDTVLQDLYTGVDYSLNGEKHLYFNLLYPVIAYAAEQRMRTLSLGQTSYTFKARLGARPYKLFLFIKHRNRLIHRLLVACKSVLFPETATTTYRVFREPGADSEAAGA